MNSLRAVVGFLKVVRPLNTFVFHRVPKARVGGGGGGEDEERGGGDPALERGFGGPPQRKFCNSR